MLMAMALATQAIVSTESLQAHLADPQVRITFIGDRGEFGRGHIPGARCMDHMAVAGSNHRLPPLDDLAATLTKAGAADGTEIVLYGGCAGSIRFAR